MKIRQDMEGKQGTGLFGQIDNPTMNEFRGMLSSQLFDFLAKHYAAIRIQKCVGFVSGNEGTSLDYVKGYLEGLFYLFTVPALRQDRCLGSVGVPDPLKVFLDLPCFVPFDFEC